MTGKTPQGQWSVLCEAAGYLQETEEEVDVPKYAACDEPSEEELEAQWLEITAHVPAEDIADVHADWARATRSRKKQMLWEVRQVLFGDQDGLLPTPPPVATLSADSARASELRRRGGGASRQHASEQSSPANAGKARRRQPASIATFMKGLLRLLVMTLAMLAAMMLLAAWLQAPPSRPPL